MSGIAWHEVLFNDGQSVTDVQPGHVGIERFHHAGMHVFHTSPKSALVSF